MNYYFTDPEENEDVFPPDEDFDDEDEDYPDEDEEED